MIATFNFNNFANALNDSVQEGGVTFANLAKKWEKESDGKLKNSHCIQLNLMFSVFYS